MSTEQSNAGWQDTLIDAVVAYGLRISANGRDTTELNAALSQFREFCQRAADNELLLKALCGGPLMLVNFRKNSADLIDEDAVYSERIYFDTDGLPVVTSEIRAKLEEITR